MLDSLLEDIWIFFISVQRLKWLGYVGRMDSDRIVEQEAYKSQDVEWDLEEELIDNGETSKNGVFCSSLL